MSGNLAARLEAVLIKGGEHRRSCRDRAQESRAPTEGGAIEPGRRWCGRLGMRIFLGLVRDRNCNQSCVPSVELPFFRYSATKQKIERTEMVLGAGATQEQRRSERVKLNVPVVVMTETREREQVHEETHTITVNAHGGLFRLRMEVLTGQPMVLVNMKTNQEESCRVIRVQDMPEGDFGVAFEFDRPAPDFWSLTFPPADWNLVRS